MSDLAGAAALFRRRTRGDLLASRTPALVDAFADSAARSFPACRSVDGPQRNRLLSGPPRQTPDADPRRVYHNVAVAIDPERQLFNGAPSLLGVCIDRLELGPGSACCMSGCGLGYYSAVMAHCVGPRAESWRSR